MANTNRAHYGPVRGHHFDQSAIPHEHSTEVVDLHLGFNAVAQVSALPDGDGFLIRGGPQTGRMSTAAPT